MSFSAGTSACFLCFLLLHVHSTQAALHCTQDKSPVLLRARLLTPVGNKNIGLVRSFAVAIGRPDQPLAVGRKHWEGVEVWMIGDLLESATVNIDGVEIESAGIFLVGHVGGENDPLAAREKIRG